MDKTKYALLATTVVLSMIVGMFIHSKFFCDEIVDTTTVTKTDTVYVTETKVKVDTLLLTKIETEEVYTTKYDTIVIRDTVVFDYYRSVVKFDKKELTATTYAWALSPVDSMSLEYSIKPTYINEISLSAYKKGYSDGSGNYPTWKKYMLFGSGVLTTSMLTYLVK